MWDLIFLILYFLYFVIELFFFKMISGKFFDLLISFKSSFEVFCLFDKLDNLSLFNSLMIDWFCLFWMFLFIFCSKLFNFCLWRYLNRSMITLACFFLWMFLFISCFKLFNFCLWWYLNRSVITLACFFLWMSLDSIFIMFSVELSLFMSVFLMVKRCLRFFFVRYLTFLSN